MSSKNAKFVHETERTNSIAVVVGTRPGIVMLAPVIHGLERRRVPYFVVHTGQHYSPAMDRELFEDLELGQAHHHLEKVAEKQTHGGQTAAMIEGIEEVLLERKPSLVLVGGDANTNLAGALAARKLRLGVGHIEAGERSFDWSMPEEHNRRIIDHISDLLFTTNEKGRAQLLKEQVQGAIHVTGNTIVDASLGHARLAAGKSGMLERLGFKEGKFILMTSHREENVDVKAKLTAILEGASLSGEESGMPVVFLAHPRTCKRMEQFGLLNWAKELQSLVIVDAVRYLDFMRLLTAAAAVLTDSGGVQQEAYIHGKPCVTLRENTEWTETLEAGANRLAGALDPEQIRNCVREAVAMGPFSPEPIFGDGRASERIIDISESFAAS